MILYSLIISNKSKHNSQHTSNILSHYCLREISDEAHSSSCSIFDDLQLKWNRLAVHRDHTMNLLIYDVCQYHINQDDGNMEDFESLSQLNIKKITMSTH